MELHNLNEKSSFGQKVKKIYFAMGLIFLVVISDVALGFYLSNQVARTHTPMVDAAMEIKLEATLGHLWFEEIISGDREESFDEVIRHFDNARWYAVAMLEGGSNEEGTYLPLEDEKLRKEVEKVVEKLSVFRDITSERMEAVGTDHAGSELDKKYDAVFRDFMAQADDVETVIQEFVIKDTRQLTIVYFVLIAILLVLSAIFVLVFVGYERRRNSDYFAIQSANRSLEKEIVERKLAEKELFKMRNMFRNIIDSMPSVIVGIDPDERIIHWNLGAQESTGISSNEAMGKSMADVLPALVNELETIKSSIKTRDVVKKAKIPDMKDGDTVYSDITVYPLKTNGVEGAVIRVDDVTNRVKIEEMMIQTEKMMSVGGLAAGMAHEINNPLAGILQSAQMVKDQVSSEIQKNHDVAKECGVELETIRSYMGKRGIFDFIDAVIDSGKRASEIVSNMLNFSRKSESKVSHCDLAKLIDNTLNLAGNDYDLKKKYDFRKTEIVREYDTNLPKIPCVETEIEQVLLNLMKNAAQAMAEKTVDGNNPRLTIRTARDGDTVKMEVIDNGAGMDEAVKKRIFEPFFTTKGVGIGTGLGLSVSYFIITENHFGSIEVSSSLEEGTTFTVKLPLKREGTL